MAEARDQLANVGTEQSNLDPKVGPRVGVKAAPTTETLQVVNQSLIMGTSYIEPTLKKHMNH